nr:immunoglobulin light chain junction region [Macaca mulatta]MOX98580.1 immunoglobulin light chain junction region [Macaca mulatta]MOX99386.1 immunoglobulin light chain junction region [Macaca mulatta]
CQHSFGIPYSF